MADQGFLMTQLLTILTGAYHKRKYVHGYSWPASAVYFALLQQN